MPFFLNLYFQAPKYPLAHVSMQIRTKPRTPSLMALPGGTYATTDVPNYQVIKNFPCFYNSPQQSAGCNLKLAILPVLKFYPSRKYVKTNLYVYRNLIVSDT